MAGEGSSEEEAASDDDGSDDSEHESKVKWRALRKNGRQAKLRKRKASPAKPKKIETGASPKKRSKQTKVVGGVTYDQREEIYGQKFVFFNWCLHGMDRYDRVWSILQSPWWSRTKKELAQINLGAAKGIKGAVKTKLLKAQQYKDMMTSKMKDYAWHVSG